MTALALTAGFQIRVSVDSTFRDAESLAAFVGMFRSLMSQFAPLPLPAPSAPVPHPIPMPGPSPLPSPPPVQTETVNAAPQAPEVTKPRKVGRPSNAEKAAAQAAAPALPLETATLPSAAPASTGPDLADRGAFLGALTAALNKAGADAGDRMAGEIKALGITRASDVPVEKRAAFLAKIRGE